MAGEEKDRKYHVDALPWNGRVACMYEKIFVTDAYYSLMLLLLRPGARTVHLQVSISENEDASLPKCVAENSLFPARRMETDIKEGNFPFSVFTKELPLLTRMQEGKPPNPSHGKPYI